MFNDGRANSYDKKEHEQGRATESDFMEETAAEVAPIGGYGRGAADISRPRAYERPKEAKEEATGGAGIGTIALVLSLLSLFFAPVFMGAAGIIVGFIARRRGATGLGAWAIGIGAVSMIIAMFVRPFFY